MAWRTTVLLKGNIAPTAFGQWTAYQCVITNLLRKEFENKWNLLLMKQKNL